MVAQADVIFNSDYTYLYIEGRLALTTFYQLTALAQ